MSQFGVLYVVSTPIGNMEDMTLRAIRILKEVDRIAAEDTRHTATLLKYYGIQTPMISCHDFNERERSPELIRQIKNGNSIALVSDAGTPSVSDPGYRLVKDAIDAGVQVVPIPGASAAMTALSVSGLPTDSFTFCGFPPKKTEKRLRLLKTLSSDTKTLLFYESPSRILSFLNDLIQILGDRQGVLCREMTKFHEEFIRGCLSDIADQLIQRTSVKGECTLVIQGKDDTESISLEDIRNEIIENFKRPDITVSKLSKELAEKYAVPKKVIYKEVLMLTKTKELEGVETR